MTIAQWCSPMKWRFRGEAGGGSVPSSTKSPMQWSPLVKSGLAAPEDSVARSHCCTAKRQQSTNAPADDQYQIERGNYAVFAYALAGSVRETAGATLVTHSADSRPAGVMPAVVYALAKAVGNPARRFDRACLLPQQLVTQSTMQTLSAAEWWLPGRNRCGIGNGGGIGRDWHTARTPSRRERCGVRTGASPGN